MLRPIVEPVKKRVNLVSPLNVSISSLAAGPETSTCPWCCFASAFFVAVRFLL